jgi:hypothetical protein
MMVRPYPAFFHPQQPNVSVFITSSLCQQSASICFKNQNKDSTDNHNTQPIYIAQNTLLTSPLKNKNGQNTLECANLMSEIPFFYVRSRLGVKSAKRPQVTEHQPAGSVELMGESSGGSQPVLWSQQEGVSRFCGFDGSEFGREFRD